MSTTNPSPARYTVCLVPKLVTSYSWLSKGVPESEQEKLEISVADALVMQSNLKGKPIYPNHHAGLLLKEEEKPSAGRVLEAWVTDENQFMANIQLDSTLSGMEMDKLIHNNVYKCVSLHSQVPPPFHLLGSNWQKHPPMARAIEVSLCEEGRRPGTTIEPYRERIRTSIKPHEYKQSRLAVDDNYPPVVIAPVAASSITNTSTSTPPSISISASSIMPQSHVELHKSSQVQYDRQQQQPGTGSLTLDNMFNAYPPQQQQQQQQQQQPQQPQHQQQQQAQPPPSAMIVNQIQALHQQANQLQQQLQQQQQQQQTPPIPSQQQQQQQQLQQQQQQQQQQDPNVVGTDDFALPDDPLQAIVAVNQRIVDRPILSTRDRQLTTVALKTAMEKMRELHDQARHMTQENEQLKQQKQEFETEKRNHRLTQLSSLGAFMKRFNTNFDENATTKLQRDYMENKIDTTQLLDNVLPGLAQAASIVMSRIPDPNAAATTNDMTWYNNTEARNTLMSMPTSTAASASSPPPADVQANLAEMSRMANSMSAPLQASSLGHYNPHDQAAASGSSKRPRAEYEGATVGTTFNPIWTGSMLPETRAILEMKPALNRKEKLDTYTIPAKQKTAWNFTS